MKNINEEDFMQTTELDENLQLAENESVDDASNDSYPSFKEKRELLGQTKIVKQTWSIQEIYQKIKSGQLDLSPEYQRNVIWKRDKQTAFIESLFMGIIVPPIYVVEIPGQDVLENNYYEVVDGKQRLTTVMEFLQDRLPLSTKHLEYYSDWFGGRTFYEIKDNFQTQVSELLSSVLDIYVITANSPEFTKYDIFSRLNKGAEKLKVNEIRRAIYRSPILEKIDKFVQENLENPTKRTRYINLFTENDIKRYEDYGRFYASLSYHINSDIENGVVVGYNSRPRDMINRTLQEIQNKQNKINDNDLEKILEGTLILLEVLKNTSGRDYILNACIPYIVSQEEDLLEKISIIATDGEMLESLNKSAGTTSNVNKRLLRVKQLLSNNEE